ncbi:MAG: type II secretion system F family protein [Thermodesulfovibrionales bacterium]
MASYRYKAVNGDGAVVRGSLSAASADAALNAPEVSGLHVISLRPTSAFISGLSAWMRSRKVPRKLVIEFATNLSVMMRAGVPLLSALSDLADTAEDGHFRKRIESIRDNISRGALFSDSLKMHSDIFPEIFVRLIAVGEDTGNLEGSLKEIALHLQRTEDLNSAIFRALIYPAFAFVTASGALVFWFVYVLPKVLTIFEGMNQSVPTITRVLIAVSGVAQNYWAAILAIPAFLVVGLKVLRRYPRPAYYMDLATLKMPVLSLVITNMILGLFSEQMKILIKAGLTIDRSFDLVHDLLGNRVYKDAIMGVKEEVMSGTTISEAMGNQGIYPPMMLRMVSVGETSGTLEEQFSYLSEHYLKKLDDISQRIGKMLEPIIIFFLGLIFFVIIVGLLLPVYDLVSTLGRM